MLCYAVGRGLKQHVVKAAVFEESRGRADSLCWVAAAIARQRCRDIWHEKVAGILVLVAD